MSLKCLEFQKYQGLGNDFIIIDSRCFEVEQLKVISNPYFVRRLCNRNFSVGADGVILLRDPESIGIAQMKIFNSDGSEAEMCGNGIRCLVKYMQNNCNYELNREQTIETQAGNIRINVTEDQEVKVNMGPPIFQPSLIPTNLQLSDQDIPQGEVFLDDSTKLLVHAVSMGNPHMVIYVDSLNSIDIADLGPLLETNKNFPNKTNVHFVQIIDRNHLKIKTWERGCGITLACGTGACACLAITTKLGLCNRKCKVTLPGGDLIVEWPTSIDTITMKGPAEQVFDGSICLTIAK